MGLNQQDFQDVMTAVQSEIQLELRVKELETNLQQTGQVVQAMSEELAQLSQRPTPITLDHLDEFADELNTALETTLSNYLQPLIIRQGTLSSQLQQLTEALGQVKQRQGKLQHVQQQLGQKLQASRQGNGQGQDNKWLSVIPKMQQDIQSLQTKQGQQSEVLDNHRQHLQKHIKSIKSLKQRLQTVEYVVDQGRHNWFSKILRHLGIGR